MADIDTFIEKLMLNGLEHFRRFYGIYRGEVTANNDPEARGRIQVLVPAVGHRTPPNIWVDPSFDGAGSSRGSFHPPEVGDSVRVSFANGDASRPDLYFGGWFGTEEVPPELRYSADGRPERRGMVTRMGHSMVFSDEPDNEFVRVTWHKAASSDPARTDPAETADRDTGDYSFIELRADGGIQATSKSGATITLDPTGKTVMLLSEQGHSISMTDSAINLIDKDGNLIAINGGSIAVISNADVNITSKNVTLASGGVNLGFPAVFKAVLGEQLLAWLASHIHPTGTGPSGPPVVPPPPSMLSNTVKLK